MQQTMIEELFKAIDARDADRFAGFLAPECEFRFGNLPVVSGAAQVREFVAGFFASVAALSHVVEASWDVPGGLVCHGHVTYTRHDGSTLNVPFANIFGFAPEGGIVSYLIFADTSRLHP